ncbi:MAG: hypothetical protein V1746_01355 [bacterium]
MNLKEEVFLLYIVPKARQKNRMPRRFTFPAFFIASIFFGVSPFANAQVSNVPRLASITLVEEGETYPAVASHDGTVQIKPGKLLKERNMQSLARLLGNYIGWPADGSTVEAIGRTLASWGKGNSLYFNLLSPISIPPNLTITLYPKGSGPSFLTYTQPKLSDLDIWNNAPAATKAPSYWVDMEEPTAQQGSALPQKSASPSYYYSGNTGTESNNAGQRKDVLLRDMNQQLQNAREDRREMEERMRGLETEINQFRDKSQQSSVQLRESQTTEQNLAARLQALQKEKEDLMQETGSLARQLQNAQTAQQEADQRIRSMDTPPAQERVLPRRSEDIYQSNVESEVSRGTSFRNEAYPAPSYRSSDDRSFQQKQTSRQNRAIEEWEGVDLPLSSLPSSRARSSYDQEAAEARLRQLREEQNQLKESAHSLSRQLEDSRLNQQSVEERIQTLNKNAPISSNRMIRLDDESPLTVDVTPETDLKSATATSSLTGSEGVQDKKAVEREVQQRINVMVEELQKDQNSSGSKKSNAPGQSIPVIDEEPPDSLQMRQSQPSNDSVVDSRPAWQGRHLLARAGIRDGI